MPGAVAEAGGQLCQGDQIIRVNDMNLTLKTGQVALWSVIMYFNLIELNSMMILSI